MGAYSAHLFCSNRPHAELQKLDGVGDLWFAGSYTQDIDLHESGLRSAIEIARLIIPLRAI